ncbi:hypothetical protein B0H12DRAFT_1069881 [Mycena haematopus]|nr:hypothetical protein B0H12DRAFT_1069881 [Mycena haematopus]
MFVHDWGIPGINLPVPPARVGPSRDVPPFKTLRFSPLGLYDLRRRLGAHPSEPGVFLRYRERFLTSDVAWFAGGASTDGKHVPATPGFFSDFATLRDSLPTGAVGNEARRMLNERMQHAVFDLATLWDRTFGGTTMIMHVEGTTMPNTPTEPQYLRAATYLPPGFVAAHPASHAAIARIVQTFIEAIGVPTVQQWRTNALLRGWSLTQQGLGASPNATTSDLIPTPAPSSAHYKFLGRPVGALEALLSTAPVPVVMIPDDDGYDNDNDNDFANELTMDLMDATARACYAEAESAERLEQIRNLEQQVDILIARVAAADALSADLQDQLLSTRRGTVTRATPPTTPSRSQLRAVHTPASGSSPRQPPPYTAAGVNTRSTSFPAPSMNPRSPLAAPHDNQAGGRPDALDMFIFQENLQPLAADIRVVIRAYAPVKWYEQLLTLGLDAAVISRMLDAIA